MISPLLVSEAWSRWLRREVEAETEHDEQCQADPERDRAVHRVPGQQDRERRQDRHVQQQHRAQCPVPRVEGGVVESHPSRDPAAAWPRGAVG